MKWTLAIITALGLSGAVGYWALHASAATAPAYRTVAVERGDLAATISATGTIEPEEVVDVGAQVAGMVQNFGRDPRDAAKAVDYGTPVEEGTVLAQIDPAVYQSQVDQARANLQKADADLLQMQAKLKQAGNDWDRAKNLSGSKGVISGLDYDTTLATYDSAKSALAVGQASIAQAKASLKLAETNLGYCTIKSPVKGIIVDRRVNVGQTVVSSLNAPSLFLIAKDLKRMQIWASVNEADIGQIHAGQGVKFSVDAYPGETFSGTVAQIRLNATMTQNVVTYTVVVSTENSDGRLLPYLTANLLFQVSQRDKVLKVPNAALRWKPQPGQVAPEARAAFMQSQRRESSDKTAEGDHPGQATLWVEDGAFVRPLPVITGLTDGSAHEIVKGDVTEGMKIVIGTKQAESKGPATSPFTPQIFGGKK